jgi:hypothetical protein
MLDALIDNQIHWHCQGQDEEEETCGLACEASIDEAEYRLSSLGKKRGAVIALPRCTCGAQTFLKADYTLKELSKVVCAVQNEQGVIWAYVLPLRYVRNLRLQWMLYVAGRAEPPLLPLPNWELLAHPEMAEIDTDVAHALWFGYLTMKYGKEQSGGITSNSHYPFLSLPAGDTDIAGPQLTQFDEER